MRGWAISLLPFLLGCALLSGCSGRATNESNRPDAGLLLSPNKLPDSGTGLDPLPANPPDPDKIYAQSTDPNSSQAVIVGLPGAVESDVTFVTILNLRTGGSTRLATYPSAEGSSFGGTLSDTEPGDILRIWGDGPSYAPGGPGINSIDEKVQYWSARFPTLTTAFARASDGSLWVGGWEGIHFVSHRDLARPPDEMDRIYPKRYEIDDDDRVPIRGSSITSLADDGNGGVFFASCYDYYARLHHLVPTADGRGAVTTYHSSNSGLDSGSISALLPADGGGLWIGGDGLTHLAFRNSVPVFAKHLPGTAVSSIARDSDGSLWVGSFNSGLIHMIPEPSGYRPVRFSTVHGLPRNDIKRLAPDGQGNIWVVSSAGIALVAIEGSSARVAYTPDPSDRLLAGWPVHGLASDNSGGVWARLDHLLVHFSTDGTSVRYRDYRLQHHGMVNLELATAVSDGEGGVWVNAAGGPTRVTERNGAVEMVTYANRVGIPNSQIKVVGADETGGAWIGTMNGVTHLTFDRDGIARFENFLSDAWFPNGWVVALLSDRSGGAYVSALRGLYRIRRSPSGGWETTYMRPAAKSLALDEEGGLWVGDYQDGVYHLLASGGSARYTVADGLPDARTVDALAVATDGAVWVGTDVGLARIDERAASPVASFVGRVSWRIGNLAPDLEGGVWLHDGIRAFRAGIVRGELTLTPFDVLPAGATRISGVVGDGRGGIYFGHDLGLGHLVREGNVSRIRHLFAGDVGLREFRGGLPVLRAGGGIFVPSAQNLLLIPERFTSEF